MSPVVGALAVFGMALFIALFLAAGAVLLIVLGYVVLAKLVGSGHDF